LKKRAVLLTLLAAVLVALAVFAIVLSRQRLQRHRLFRAAPAGTQPVPPQTAHRVGIPPVGEWTATFSALESSGSWSDLSALLDDIEKKQPDLYNKWSLAYLHARARLENDEPGPAAQKLAPFTAAGNPFRDLALFHQAELEEGRDAPSAASRARHALIFGYPASIYRGEAIDDETEYLASQKDPRSLIVFADRLRPGADTKRRRDLDAHIVEALTRAGDSSGALQRGLGLLATGTTDDAADRAARALDTPELLRRMTVPQWISLGEAMQTHRHFDRAVAILTLALNATPPGVRASVARPVGASHAPTPAPHPAKKAPVPKASAKKGSGQDARTKRAKDARTPPAKPPAPPAPVSKRDELFFAIGRSYFGDEKFAPAQQVYLRAAGETRDPRWKCTFLFHASRAVQLQGDDANAERLMTEALAVPGHFPATTAALTQRIRTRLKHNRAAEAAADLALLRKLAPNDHAIVEGSLAYAVAMVASHNETSAVVILNAIPPALLDKYDQAEVAYWRARALENRDPRAAFTAYLQVLRSPVPTHFAYFARQRLDAPAMASRLTQELATRDAEVRRLVAAKQFLAAKEVATDRILLSSRDHAAALKQLADIYGQLPPYRAMLEATPRPFPAISAASPPAGRAERLMAMGLFDDAADAIPRLYPLHPFSSGLTQSLALNRGSASRQSIYAIEVLMNGAPDDYVPELLPRTVRELLYPRYFHRFIADDSKKFGADPTLVLAIMREESRFNPRAKSEAAARGLLQFIISTARDIGRGVGLVDVAPDDLYDPRIIIQLGAKYVATLTTQFQGDRYQAAGAYNAGPKQVALWSRLAAAPGDDYFLSSINFDETKDYVRKVMNSYRRYSEIYGNAGPQGGLRAEP
jgi:soluble lytic murein transglycosylase-like protein